MSQPVEVYPNNLSRQPSSHSHGSYATVFIILAIILVLSVIACVVGRIRSRGESKPRQAHVRSKEKGKSSRQSNHEFEPREGDIEFGFNKPMASSKVGASEGFKGFNYKPSHINGEGKSHVRFADLEFKQGPGQH